jgi:hypothetical protein
VDVPAQLRRPLSARPCGAGRTQSSGRFALHPLDIRCGQIVDRDPARLHGVRNLSNQLDLEQAVVEPCSLDPDVGGRNELPLERPRRIP